MARKITPLIILFSLMIGSCRNDHDNCIDGEGPAESRQWQIEAFSVLNLYGPVDIWVGQDTAARLSAEGQANILAALTVEQFQEELTIGESNCFRSFEDLALEASTPRLSEVNILGSGDVVTVGSLNRDRIDCLISGSGNMLLGLNVEEVHSRISGSGDITISGLADYQYWEGSGSGNYQAFAVRGEEAEVKLSGSGNCEVNVSDRLVVTISGSGNVYYKGSPAISADITGSGRLVKVN